MMHLSIMLDPDTCMYDAYIYVPRSLTLMHVCMMHISMVLDLDPEACVYDACVYDVANFVDACICDAYIYYPMMHIYILIHVTTMHICMMHLSMILEPDACIYDAFIYVPRSLTMMHVCMMHISMILDLDPEACAYGACVYDAANFVTDERTDGRTRRF